MRSVVQNLGNGDVTLIDQPVPRLSPGHLLIRSRASLISAGTERMLVEFGRASFVNKALSQPDKVKQVLQKMATDGVGATVRAVRARLDEPHPLGYCNAGVVAERAADVMGFDVRDRVASN